MQYLESNRIMNRLIGVGVQLVFIVDKRLNL